MDKKQNVFAVCVALAVMSIIVSNVITNKQTDFFGFAVTCGTFLVPVDYIVSDLVAEIWGYERARFVTLVAFGCNALAVAFFALTIAAPSFWTFANQNAFEAVLGNTPRVLVASFTAFVVGSLSNAKIMDLMHARDGESRLALRCIASTVVGEFLDMTVFTLMAFAGVLPPAVLAQMIVVSALIKIAVECIIYPLVTSRVIRRVKAMA
jgi:uncharacterized integral membrane protein (TIGR00697 family)